MARLVGGIVGWRKWVTVGLLVALFAGALGVAVYKRAGIADFVGHASEVLGQSASAAGGLPLAKSLVALLDQRSPGERTKAELANDKQRLAARPQQRALGKVRPALPAPFVKALTTPPVAALVPEVVPVVALNSPLVAPLLSAPIIGSTPAVLVGGGGPGGGVGGPGGGGVGPGGGSSPPGTDVVPPVVAVVSPVPEPATWLTMILGFYMLARVVRKQRPAKAQSAAFAA